MPSWHQKQSPQPLYNDVYWTLMIETHMTSLSLHSSREAAEELGKNTQRRHKDTRWYVLPPMKILVIEPEVINK